MPEPAPTWDNGLVRLYHADARQIPLPDNSVHCVVTSPPYLGLRSYGDYRVQMLWGTWEHFTPPRRPRRAAAHQILLKVRASLRGGVFCPKGCCWLGALGEEPTAAMYVDHLVQIFREVRRVLRPDGTVWLNLGDSYAGSGGVVKAPEQQGRKRDRMLAPAKGKRIAKGSARWGGGDYRDPAFKRKDLMLIPARVAIALQEDGWWVRSRIDWIKPNPMRESVSDRPTSAHEDIYLLTPSEHYFYDAVAIRDYSGNGWHGSKWAARAPERHSGENRTVPAAEQAAGANAVNVWTFAAAGYKGAHFATFPEALPTRCILAGTSERGVCSQCGAPWKRVTEKTFVKQKDVSAERGIKGAPGQKPSAPWSHWQGAPRGSTQVETVGWAPTCESMPGHTGKTGTAYPKGSSANRLALLRQAARAQGAEYAVHLATVDWRPSCCDCHETIATPHRGGMFPDDPTPTQGRRGYARKRNPKGPRSLTRGQQRAYARQLRESPHLPAIREMLGTAVDHYMRFDSTGARPLPPDALDILLARGWLRPVAPGACGCANGCAGAAVVPAVVLDPFSGSGTTAVAAQKLRRRAVGLDLNAEYTPLAVERLNATPIPLALEF